MVSARPFSGTTRPVVVNNDPVPLGVAGNWTLTFQDEFNGSSIDESSWQIVDPAKSWGLISADPPVGTAALSTYGNTADFGNVQPSSSSPSASNTDCDWSAGQISVSSSVLTLNQTLITGVHYGGCIVSRFPITQGFYEARIQFTSGWPAWWIAWHGDNNPGTDDEFLGVEMDIAEAVGWENNGNYISSNAHTGGYGANHIQAGTQVHSTDGQWHVVGFWWTNTFIRWYVDGVLVREITNPSYVALLASVHYMILNNAKPANGSNGTASWDYVRHWTGG